MSNRDSAFVKLFRWALAMFAARSKKGVAQKHRTAALMVRLLSVEGVRQELQVSEMKGGLPREHYETLRAFRKLTQENRARKAQKLLKEWSE
jgi:hypothetical protein